uniref:TNFR-Cys domain-containing protein n=1 Tax=Tetraodon nigroviridis TaxID=99883 RepID=H3CW68_TETNG
TYEHHDPSTGKTLLCDKCRPGTHLAAHCTPSTPTKCLPCEENQFTELWNYLPRCLYCSNYCDDSQEVAKECSATNDRVCRCKEGLYSSSGFCFSHSECQPGLGVKLAGTSETDTVCERCVDGYFSNSSSANEPCVKHQECAPGQTALLNGSASQDALCGTCEDLARRVGETYRSFIAGFFGTHKMRPKKMRRLIGSSHTPPPSVRSTLGQSVPKQRGPLLEQMTSRLARIRPRILLETLRRVQRNSLANKLEKTLAGIQQQNPGC